MGPGALALMAESGANENILFIEGAHEETHRPVYSNASYDVFVGTPPPLGATQAYISIRFSNLIIDWMQ